MKNKWFCTDDDCSQYCRENEDGTYDFIEMVWLDICKEDEGYPDKEYIVKSANINLNEYTDYDKECAISSYYESFGQIYETYGMEIERIIAECIFEDLCGNSCNTTDMMTKKEAENFIKGIVL